MTTSLLLRPTTLKRKLQLKVELWLWIRAESWALDGIWGFCRWWMKMERRKRAWGMRKENGQTWVWAMEQPTIQIVNCTIHQHRWLKRSHFSRFFKENLLRPIKKYTSFSKFTLCKLKIFSSFFFKNMAKQTCFFENFFENAILSNEKSHSITALAFCSCFGC